MKIALARKATCPGTGFTSQCLSAARMARARVISSNFREVEMIPKYAQIEFERRWLVENPPPPKNLAGVESSSIDDRYITGTRMRLRKTVNAKGETTYKLGKKYGPIKAGVEPITNIYLTEAEYELYAKLPARTLSKKRYRVKEGEMRYSLDIHEESGKCFAEAEARDERSLQKIPKPTFATREITGEDALSGASLAK